LSTKILDFFTKDISFPAILSLNGSDARTPEEAIEDEEDKAGTYQLPA
jgi:hypothetical protein